MSTENENSTREIQDDIKIILGKLGWSHKRFVGEYNRALKFQSELTTESFKKQLSRPTTKPTYLKMYLDFIHSHNSYRRLGLVKPVHISKDEFGEDFNRKMAGISKLIHDRVKSGS